MTGRGGDVEAPRRLARPYALVGGRTRLRGADLAIEALVVTTAHGQGNGAELRFEHRDIARLCASAISIAEVAARIHVPLGVARVLVDDLLTDGIVAVHQPPSGDDSPNIILLERVLDGLRAI